MGPITTLPVVSLAAIVIVSFVLGGLAFSGDCRAWLVKFLGPTFGSLRDNINWSDMGRTVVASLSVGGSLYTVLLGIQANSATIFTDPTQAAFAGMLLTVLLDLPRRFKQSSSDAPDTASNTPIKANK